MKIEIKQRIEIWDKVLEKTASAEMRFNGDPDFEREEAKKMAVALFESLTLPNNL